MGIPGVICGGYTWTMNEATTVCRQLGYNYGLPNTNVDGRDTGGLPFWMEDVSCSDITGSLWDCSFSAWGSTNGCPEGDHAGVYCYNERKLTTSYGRSLPITSSIRMA